MKRIPGTVILVAALAVAVGISLAVLAVNLRAPRAFRQPLDVSQPGTELRTVLVYALAADSLGLVPMPREVPAGRERRELVGDLVHHLTTPAPGCRAPLPPGTRLLHYFETDDGGAVLDLSAEMGSLSPVSIEEERLRLAALVRTMALNVPGVRRIRLLVEGNTLDRWGRHLRPGSWVEVEAW